MADGISHNWDEECKPKNSAVYTPIYSTTLPYIEKSESRIGLVLAGAGFALGFVAAYALMLVAGGNNERPKKA